MDTTGFADEWREAVTRGDTTLGLDEWAKAASQGLGEGRFSAVQAVWLLLCDDGTLSVDWGDFTHTWDSVTSKECKGRLNAVVEAFVNDLFWGHKGFGTGLDDADTLRMLADRIRECN